MVLHQPVVTRPDLQRVSVTAANREYKAMAARRGTTYLACGQVGASAGCCCCMLAVAAACDMVCWLPAAAGITPPPRALPLLPL